MTTSSAGISTLHSLATTRPRSSGIASRRCYELYKLHVEGVGESDKTGKIMALPELLNAKIGESLGLVLSRHVAAYTTGQSPYLQMPGVLSMEL